MTPSALSWLDDDPNARRRWVISGVAVFCGYAAVAAGIAAVVAAIRPGR